MICHIILSHITSSHSSWPLLTRISASPVIHQPCIHIVYCVFTIHTDMVLLLLLLLYISTYIQMQRIPEHTYCLCHTSTIHTSYIYRYSQIARIQRLAIHAPRGTSSSRTFARDIRRLNPRPQHAAAIDCWRPCVAGCARRLCVCVCV